MPAHTSGMDGLIRGGKVVKTRFGVVNFDKSFLHRFSTKIRQILKDDVKHQSYLLICAKAKPFNGNGSVMAKPLH